MAIELECHECSHPIPIGNGWNMCGEDVTCRQCGEEWVVYSDSDASDNYWFGLEKQ